MSSRSQPSGQEMHQTMSDSKRVSDLRDTYGGWIVGAVIFGVWSLSSILWIPSGGLTTGIAVAVLIVCGALSLFCMERGSRAYNRLEMVIREERS